MPLSRLSYPPQWLRVSTAAMALLFVTFDAAAEPPADGADQTIRHFAPGRQREQLQFERGLMDAVDPHMLRAFHNQLSTAPHVAGSPGDEAAAHAIRAIFVSLGLEVEWHETFIWLPRPVVAEVLITSPVYESLAVREEVLAEDPFTGHDDLTFGWNAYSGSGTVEAGIVYVNYGTKQDFEVLRELGVDCTGKIVIARYGGNFRGYKAKFAEQAGAAGLIIYSDPKDVGYGRGAMYPEGGFANPSYIQRGSVKALAYPGDPLTPMIPATWDAPRLDPNEVGLPKIPIQPIGWGAAEKILSRMEGEAVPPPWKGGLPIEYNITGGETLRVRLSVFQQTELTPIYNIIGTLRGTKYPDERVIVGAHYDAWSFGAGDPNSGTIAVLEAARCFAEAASMGKTPDRSISFACWGAEEFGIIGSTEWVEEHRDELFKNAVAYLNLDMASMGPLFGASASPLLKTLMIDASRYVPQPARPGLSEEDLKDRTAFDDWLARSGAVSESKEPRVGDFAGGSDHIGFYCFLGIPAAGLNGGGSPGVSYHSNYETLAWYRKIVGDDYASPRMVTQATSVVLARLANADILPFDPSRYALDIPGHLRTLTRLGLKREMLTMPDVTGIAPELAPIMVAIEQARHLRAENVARWADLHQPEYAAVPARLNQTLLHLERLWLMEEGIPGRPFFRNLYAATDEDSGYAAWMLPGLRYAIEHEEPDLLHEMVERYVAVIGAVDAALGEVLPEGY